LFSKRLTLFNKKRTKNIDEIKTIKNICEAIAKRLRKKKKGKKNYFNADKKKEINKRIIYLKKRGIIRKFLKKRDLIVKRAHELNNNNNISIFIRQRRSRFYAKTIYN